MSTMPSLAQVSPADLSKVLTNNPSLLAILVNLDGTGLTADDALAALMNRLTVPPAPEVRPHKLRPDSYRRFRTVRGLEDDAASAALFDLLSTITRRSPIDCPHVCRKMLWEPKLAIGNAADLAATTRKRLLQPDWHDHTHSFRLDADGIDEIDNWFMASYGIRLIGMEADNHKDQA